MSPRQRDCKRNVRDVALVGSSARIPIVQKMIQEFFNGKEQRFTELLVLPSTRKETVLPMNWEGGAIHWRDVEEQTSVPSRSGELLTKFTWHCKHYAGRGVMKLHESGAAFGPGYGSACLEDASLKTAQDPDGAVPSVS